MTISKHKSLQPLFDVSSTSSSTDDEEDDDGARPRRSQRGKPRGHDARSTAILERAYSYSQSITHVEKLALAEQTGLQPRQVTIWFQNKRNRNNRKARQLAASGICDTAPSEQDHEQAQPTPPQPKPERKRKLATLNIDATTSPRRPQSSPCPPSDVDDDELIGSDAEGLGSPSNVAASALAAATATTKRPRFSDDRSPSAGSSCSSAYSGMSAFTQGTDTSIATTVDSRSSYPSSASSHDGDDCSSSVFGETSYDLSTFADVSSSSQSASASGQRLPGGWCDPALADARRVRSPSQQSTTDDELAFTHGSNMPRYDLSDLELSPRSLSLSLEASCNEALMGSWQRQPVSPCGTTARKDDDDDEWEDVEMEQAPSSEAPSSAARTHGKKPARHSSTSSLGMAPLEPPSRHAWQAHAGFSSVQMTPTQASFGAASTTWRPAVPSSSSLQPQRFTTQEEQFNTAWLAELEAMLANPSSTCLTSDPNEPIPCITLTDIEMSQDELAAFAWAKVEPASSSSSPSSSSQGQHEEAQTWFDFTQGFVPPPPSASASASASPPDYRS
ncbi:uncharacterized protein PFL1_03265 [Pseudozyma flocculosa PF-1]|uniref:Homeobox domain-containing protein n=1 Tax=Pseudozyma flocculosa PF-1 TaxID=1277687 RepID=A0A061HAC2_9BASI|nr:uncharacterized protein PFL1_03265 [Pseudozyma flocculosa PF-1]EPQ28975.1 hypothetical protein PFL1_03265 [Pseudozyma flocculosa PF-1]